MKRWLIGLMGMVWVLQAQGQALPVVKTNPMPVLMHYMPWFETPATNNGAWGLHWTMGNRNPNVIVNAATGQRQIASKYYPVIGPYASSDPDVMEYHLLLMKYSGVDGLLIDFYGNGGNDLPLLLRNTNAIVPKIGEVGLKFGVVFEDQFAATRAAARANMGYVGTHYTSLPSYFKIFNKALVGVFGPQRYQTPADWTSILDTLPADPNFVTLWYASDQAGTNADGEFSWVYSDSTAGLRNFYLYRAGGLGTAIGSAWPGFESYYAQGGWGGPTWTIKPRNGQTLTETLALAAQYATRLNALQLVTWNDFGEGTMLEPTLETGYTYLEKVQAFTGVSYTIAELQLIHRLYLLRKRFAGNTGAQRAMNRASGNFTRLNVSGARTIIDSLEAVPTGLVQRLSGQEVRLFPDPAVSVLHIDMGMVQPKGVSILDIAGKAFACPIQETDLDVSGLKAGLYLIQIETDRGLIRKPFIKQ